MYEIRETNTFNKSFEKRIPHHLKDDIRRRLQKLSKAPYSCGKPLTYSFLREIKAAGFRIYYLIFDQEIVVLLVDVSDKKIQRQIINGIKLKREEFRRFVQQKRLSRKVVSGIRAKHNKGDRRKRRGNSPLGVELDQKNTQNEQQPLTRAKAKLSTKPQKRKLFIA